MTSPSLYLPFTNKNHLSSLKVHRDPDEPDAGDNQGPAETVDRTRIGTGPTSTLTARQGT